MMTNYLKINWKFNFLLISTLIVLPTSYASMQGLSIVSQSVPYEMELMIKHLKVSQLTKEETETLIADLDLINDDLSSLDQKTLMFLFKSESYKSILTNQYLKLDDKVQISATTLDLISKKLEKHSVIYSEFSKWQAESISNDLLSFSDANFLNRYQNIDRSNSKEVLKAKKLKRLLKYTSPLLSAFLALSPEDFNKLSKNIILDTFSRISKKSFAFKSLYFKGQSSTEKIFKLPSLSLTSQDKSLDKNEISNKVLMENESKQMKLDAQNDVKTLEDTDLSGASESINEITPKN